jgi:hypothetical protein
MDGSNWDGSYQGCRCVDVVTTGSVSHNDSHDAGKCNKCLKIDFETCSKAINLIDNSYYVTM